MKISFADSLSVKELDQSNKRKALCFDHLVEPVGIEPTSKQGTKMLSTRLAAFGFRNEAGKQRPTSNLSALVRESPQITFTIFSFAMLDPER